MTPAPVHRPVEPAPAWMVAAPPPEKIVPPFEVLTPNVKTLIIQKMSLDAVPLGGGIEDAVKFLTTPGAIGDGWRKAGEWVKKAIQTVRSVPGYNVWKDSDDESIATEIVRREKTRPSVLAKNIRIGNPGAPIRDSDSRIISVMDRGMPQHIQFARAFEGLFRPARYKIYFGGRGGAKSWSVARALVLKTHSKKLRIGCFRELQNSIKDSVHRLIVDQIEALGLTGWFEITQASIVSKATGSEFLFKGLRHNSTEIKSMEGIDIAWIEEAQLVSQDSWELLIPTIRKEGSEIWITFNPIEADDATYDRFVTHTPPNSIIQKVNFDGNPWFPQTLEFERLHMLKVDPIAYAHVWGGECKVIGDAIIFKGKYVVEPFETPTDPSPRFYHGADFGFAVDPFALMRMYVTDNPMEYVDVKGILMPKQTQDLWIDREAYGVGVELDDLADLIDKRIGDSAREWPIYGDNSRPETISFLRRRGFRIESSDKWKGCVEDGIEHLRTFRTIHIHANNCPHQVAEARLYSYKVDKNTKEILPEIVDKHNHCWDADRYALDKLIQSRGIHSVWANLAK